MRLASVVLVAVIAVVPVLDACSSRCTIEVTCPQIAATFEVPFTAEPRALDGTRFELCRGSNCKSSAIVGTSCSTLICRREADGRVMASAEGLGPLRARVLVREPDGSERVIAERSGTIEWEEYEYQTVSCADEKDCTHYVLR